MKRMSIFLFCMMVVVMMAACAGGPPTGSQPYKGTGGGPVITNYYCQSKANYGSPLNVYLEVDDPDGNISHIATVVNQTGYGTYPTSWKYLPYRYRGHFKGYLQWNTMSSEAMSMPEWTNITITVAVYDKAGNQSNNIVFPVQFVNEAVATPPLPPPFNQGDLPRIGYIDIDLENPNAPDGPMGGPKL